MNDVPCWVDLYGYPGNQEALYHLCPWEFLMFFTYERVYPPDHPLCKGRSRRILNENDECNMDDFQWQPGVSYVVVENEAEYFTLPQGPEVMDLSSPHRH